MQPPPFQLRLLFAALASTLASLVFRAAEAAFPGAPQSTVLATRTVPFFEHMIAAGWIGLLAYFGAGPILARLPLNPKAVMAVIAAASVATGALQWWFPNY